MLEHPICLPVPWQQEVLWASRQCQGQGRSCGARGAGVKWWFSLCPACSCSWKHNSPEKALGDSVNPSLETNDLWPSPTGAAVCFSSSSHSSSSSSYSSSMLWEGSVLFLVLFAWNRNIHFFTKENSFPFNPLSFDSLFLLPHSPGFWSCAFPQTCQLCWAIQKRMYVTATWDLVIALAPAAGLQVAWDKTASVLTLPAHKMCHPAYSSASK